VVLRDRRGEQPRQGDGVQVLVGRPRRVVAPHAPSSPYAQLDRLDGDAPRPVGPGGAGTSQRGAGQRPVADEAADELRDAHFPSGSATTQRSWPLDTPAPTVTARPLTIPPRAAAISVSLLIASTQ